LGIGEEERPERIETKPDTKKSSRAYAAENSAEEEPAKTENTAKAGGN